MKTTKRIRLNDAHLLRMVDDTGIFQHAKYDVPNPKEGYTTDDNARLMAMAAMYYEVTGDEKYLDLAYRALSFLKYAEQDGWFRNFMGFDRRFLEDKGSHDCFGRCVLCLGFVTSRKALPVGLRSAAHDLLEKTIESANGVPFLRAAAYSAMGLAMWDHPKRAERIAEQLATVASSYHGNIKPDWFWFEGEMTYCNATLPNALFWGYEVLGGEDLLKIALDSLRFLLGQTMREGFFWPVGCKGWNRRGEAPALYDQQPVEACSTLIACLKAYRITGDDYFSDQAQLCLEWFLGRNSLGVTMIDPISGGCYDGLTEDGPNMNQGAESLLSWYISVLAMQLFSREHGDGSQS